MPTLQRARGVQYKTLDTSIQEVTGRHIEFIASQEIQDRDGDIISVKGIDTRDFMRNSVLLADHDPTFILGTITKLWKERLPDGWALLAKAEILPAGTSGRIDERYTAIKHGAAKGVSIGFMGREREPIATGWFYKSISLMEVSSVAIPSCQSCLITSKSHTRHSQKEDDMQTDELWLEVSDDFFTKWQDPTSEAFDAMLAQLRQAWPLMSTEMTQEELGARVDASFRTLGPHATIAALVTALMQQGVYAPKRWRSEDAVFDIDERDVARAVARVVAEEAGAQVRAAFNQALGRLD